MLDAAQQRSCVGGRLVRGNCLFLPFRDCSFDLIICSFAVEHIANLQRMAGELARVVDDHAPRDLLGRSAIEVDDPGGTRESHRRDLLDRGNQSNVECGAL